MDGVVDGGDQNIKTVNFKIAPYVLNEISSKKFKLKSVDVKYDVERKDGGKQYIIITIFFFYSYTTTVFVIPNILSQIKITLYHK